MLGENLVALRVKERVRQDSEPIATIYRNLGTSSAEQVVTRALRELALTMAGLAAQVREREMQDLSRQLRRLQRMAENLGLITLGLVAADLTLCITCQDVTAFSAVVACINNTGPGLGLVGPATNYAVLEDFQTWVCTFAMLLGRLEFLTVLVLFTRHFWRR